MGLSAAATIIAFILTIHWNIWDKLDNTGKAILGIALIIAFIFEDGTKILVRENK